MYVIEDKKGRFYAPAYGSMWTRNLQKAMLYGVKENAIKNCLKENGERVFEVHLTLGKQVK